MWALLNATHADRHPSSKLNMRLLEEPPVMTLGAIRTRELNNHDVVRAGVAILREESGYTREKFFDEVDPSDYDDADEAYLVEVDRRFHVRTGWNLRDAAIHRMREPDFAERAQQHARRDLQMQSVRTSINHFDAEMVALLADLNAQEQPSPSSPPSPWRARLDDARAALEDLLFELPNYRGDDSVLVYDLNAGAAEKLKAAGFALLEKKGEIPEITYLVTHPQAIGAGAALIEKAVAVSRKAGSEGRLMASAGSDAALLFQT